MRRPPDYLHRPWLVEHACTCLLCTTRLHLIERLAPARSTYFVDLDGAGVRFCPGCGQQLDQSLRTGTVARSAGTPPATMPKGPDRAQAEDESAVIGDLQSAVVGKLRLAGSGRAQIEDGAASRPHFPPLRPH